MRSQTIANTIRIEQVVSVFMRQGLQVPLARLGLARCASLRCRLHCTWNRWRGKGCSKKPWPRAVRDALIELGPAFVKFGQILSVRSDLVPAALVEELRTLQSAVPPFSFPEVKARVEAELGGPLEQTFARFTKAPLAAASMAQVHEAELKDGTRVAVKVKRPGIDEVVRRDMDVLTWLAAKAERHGALARSYRVEASARELRRYTLRELDFRQEARVARRIRALYGEREGVRVPQIHHASPGLLVMEFIDGFPLDDLEAMARHGVDRERLVHLALDAVLAQIFDFGLFHGDPHPGNLHVTPAGELAFLDFGIFGEMDEGMQRLCALLMASLVEGDVDLASGYLLRMATLDPGADPEGFRQAIGECYRAWRGASVDEYGFARLLYDEITLGVRFGIVFPPEMVLLGKAMVTIEGVILAVNPEIDISSAAAPFLTALRARLFGKERLVKSLMRSLPLWFEVAERLPLLLPGAIDRLLTPPAKPAQPADPPADLPLLPLALVGGGVVLLLGTIGPLWSGLSIAGGLLLIGGLLTSLWQGHTR